MLYPNLQRVRSCGSEVAYWKKMKRKAEAADSLTKAGIRKRQKLNEINICLELAETEYSAAKNIVLQDERFQQMNPQLQNACIEYYFNGLKTEKAESTYNSTSFLRDVRNYCHKI